MRESRPLVDGRRCRFNVLYSTVRELCLVYSYLVYTVYTIIYLEILRIIQERLGIPRVYKPRISMTGFVPSIGCQTYLTKAFTSVMASRAKNIPYTCIQSN
jgi:hypothetical protein